MTSPGCCTVNELSGQLNERQRSARTVVGITSLASQRSLLDAQE
jgi:hypothetical protein